MALSKAVPYDKRESSAFNSQTVQACNILYTSMSDSECCDSVQVPSKNHNMRQLDAVGMSVSLTFVTNEAADLCDSSLQFTPGLVHNKTPPCHAKQWHRYRGCDGIHVSDACTPRSLRSDESYGCTPQLTARGTAVPSRKKSKHPQRTRNPPKN